MKYNLKVYSIWEFGQRKDSQGNPHQEDSLFPAFGKQSDSDRLFILCDGMGGHDAGEVASATVCEAMSKSILNDGHDKDGIFTEQDFDSALKNAFDALDAKDTGAEKKMGTTLTLLKFHKNGATIAHIGDSRVYHIRPGKDGEDTKILFQTEDHSLINDLIKVGELTREEARNSNQKNVITRAMQPNLDRRPKADVYTTSDIKTGDYFYICSDGMLEKEDMEDGESLKNIFSQLGGDDKQKVEILKSVTEDNKDNHTAFVIHVLDVIDPIVVPPVQIPAQNSDLGRFAAIVEDSEEDIVEPELSNGEPYVPRKKKRIGLIALLCLLFAALLGFGVMYFVNHFQSDYTEVQPNPVGSGESQQQESPSGEQEASFEKGNTIPNSPTSPVSTDNNNNTSSKPENSILRREDVQRIQQASQEVSTSSSVVEEAVPDIAPAQFGETTDGQNEMRPKKEVTPNNQTNTSVKPIPATDKGNGSKKEDTKVNLEKLNKLNQKTKSGDEDVAKSDAQKATEQKEQPKNK